MKTFSSPLAILVTCFFLAQQSYGQCLNGTYTVGGSNPDYTSISGIFNDLESNGVCGPVIFNFRPGSYFVNSSSSGRLDSIPGNSAQNPVTFRAENGDSSSVFLQRAGSSNHIIDLSRTNYVVFEQLSFRVSSTSIVSTGWNLKLSFDNEYVEVRNCAFLASYLSTTHEVQAHIGAQFLNQDIVIQNCLFEKAVHAIYTIIYPGGGTCTIQNNQCIDQTYGIRLQNFETVNIEGNTFKQFFSRNLQISDVGMVNIQKNSFNDEVQLFNVGSSAAGQTSLFANNFCHGNYGPYNLSLVGSVGFNIVHNTFYLKLAGSSSSNFYFGNSDSIEVFNNIFVMRGLGKFVNAYDDITNKAYVFDYNGYERVGGFDFQADTISFTSLSQFQQATSWGMHSLVDTFVFEGSSIGPGVIDLHLAFEDSSNLDILDKGTPLTYISTDIDDDLRDPLHPDLGADETTIVVPSFDLSIVGENLPDTVCPGSHEMAVSIQNFSPTVVEEYDVFLTQDGQLIDSFFVRPIPFSSDTSTFIFPNGINDSMVVRKLFIPPDTSLHFQMWVNMGNGVLDTVVNNDTLSFSLSSTSLPQPQLPLQVDICRGDSVVIADNQGFPYYHWSSGDSSSAITVAQSGIHRLEVADAHGCKNVTKTYTEVMYTTDDFWITRSDNIHKQVLEGNGNTVYIGGKFDRVGPSQPQLGLFDLDTEQHIPVEKLRSQNNEFQDLISDGNGGWYMIAGYHRINNQDQYRIIHRDSLARPLPLNVEANDIIFDLLLHEDRLFVCGRFDTIQGQRRVGVAAIDPETGLLLEYDPGFHSATITQLAVYDETIILVGNMLRLNVKNVGYDYTIAFTDYLSGTIQPDEKWTWVYDEFDHPSVNQNYIGFFVEQEGDYLVVSTSAIVTKVLDLSTQQSILDIPGLPNTMEIHQGTLYLGYDDRIDRLDLSSQTLGLFVDVIDDPDYSIEDLAFTDSSAFVGGFFMMPGDSIPVSVAEFELGTANQTPFSCIVFSSTNQEATVNALEVEGHRLIMGGDFESIGGMKRKNLYEFDLISQRPTDWNPAPDSTVRALELNDNQLYVGGIFSEIDGQSRNSFAVFDSAMQLVPNLTYPIIGSVFDFAFTDTSVYVAGYFPAIQESRNHSLIAIQKQTGDILPFEAGLSYFMDLGSVVEVEVIDSVVSFIGGFTELYDSTAIFNQWFCESGIAMVDATTGYVKGCFTSSSSSAPTAIYDIQAYEGKLYAAGTFNTNSSEPLKDMISIDPSILSYEVVNINTDNRIRSFDIQCDKIYLAGNFSTVNGEEESGLAIADFPSGQVYDIFDNPDQFNSPSYGYNSIAIHNGRLLILGNDNVSELDLNCFPLPPASLNLDFGTQLNSLQADFQNLSSGTGLDFQWDFGDGNTSTVSSPSHTYAQAGTYTVSLFASNECGMDTLSKQIQVGTVSNDDDLTTQFLLYPNPSTGELFVSFFHASSGPVKWEIFDQAGRLVLRQGESLPAGEQQIKLELNSWPSGMFYLELNHSGKRQGEKFVIVH